MATDNSVVMARGRVRWGLGRGGQSGVGRGVRVGVGNGMGTSVIVSVIKIKKKWEKKITPQPHTHFSPLSIPHSRVLHNLLWWPLWGHTPVLFCLSMCTAWFPPSTSLSTTFTLIFLNLFLCLSLSPSLSPLSFSFSFFAYKLDQTLWKTVWRYLSFLKSVLWS